MKRFLKEPVVQGSILLLILFNLYNILNFGFHFAMARLLDVASYGLLATLFSFIYIFGLFSESIQNIVARFAAQETKNGKLHDALKRGLVRALQLSCLVYIAFLIFSYTYLSNLLSIPFPFLAYTGLFIFSSFTLPITRGILQGTKQFLALGKNLLMESGIKVILAIILVVLFASSSLKLVGALSAVFVGVGMAFLYAWYIQLKKIRLTKRKEADIPHIKSYSLSVFVGTFVITLFLMMDILLVKALFSPEVTGAYALASLAAKTLFWGTQPISKALFPLTAQQPNKQQLLKAGGILLGLIIIALVIFKTLPAFVIYVLSGKEVLLAQEILFPLGIAVSLICLANLLLLYTVSFSTLSHTSWRMLLSFLSLLLPFLIIPVLAFYTEITLQEFTWLFVAFSFLLCAIATFFAFNASHK
jgi:O-antigen/teichoic acid export membrane protein